MSISKLRGKLYKTARVLGDIQAVQQAAKTGDSSKILKRIGRRVAGRQTGKALGKLFKWTKFRRDLKWSLFLSNKLLTYVIVNIQGKTKQLTKGKWLLWEQWLSYISEGLQVST